MDIESKFIETICIEKGMALNLSYHNERMNRTRKAHWENEINELMLEDYIRPAAYDACTRCRVVYGKEIDEVAYYPYKIRPIHSLKLVVDDEADYQYKLADRSLLNQLFAKRDIADDVLIVRKGLLTDTSIANMAAFDGEAWYTPKNPLLRGTRRQFLLDNKLISERDITVEQLCSYQKVCLFNAMIPFGALQVDIEHINY